MGAVLISNFAASDAGILLTVTAPCQLFEYKTSERHKL